MTDQTQVYMETGTLIQIPPPTRDTNTDKDLNERMDFTAEEHHTLRNPTFGDGQMPGGQINYTD